MAKEKIEFFRNQIKILDPKVSEKENIFKTAVLLLAALQEGNNIKKISKFTKLPESYIIPRAKLLRKSKIWVGSKTEADWFNKKTGGVSFWTDVLVAEGLLERVKHA